MGHTSVGDRNGGCSDPEERMFLLVFSSNVFPIFAIWQRFQHFNSENVFILLHKLLLRNPPCDKGEEEEQTSTTNNQKNIKSNKQNKNKTNAMIQEMSLSCFTNCSNCFSEILPLMMIRNKQFPPW